jgi:MOSC domain-containing protein YiiM
MNNRGPISEKKTNELGPFAVSAGKGISMEVVSVNVGLPREVIWKGMAVQTAIFKEPVLGQVEMDDMNLAGDRQADLTVHGGRDKAVYAYPSEHYAYWSKELPGATLNWGHFGENLTTKGLSEETLCVGDCLKVGSAVLRVTQPRMPCYKLALRFGRDDMIKRFLASGRSGFYFSILETGSVGPGSSIELIDRDTNQVSIAEVQRLYFGEARNPELLRKVEKLTALPQSWKRALSYRAKQAVSET